MTKTASAAARPCDRAWLPPGTAARGRGGALLLARSRGRPLCRAQATPAPAGPLVCRAGSAGALERIESDGEGGGWLALRRADEPSRRHAHRTTSTTSTTSTSAGTGTDSIDTVVRGSPLQQKAARVGGEEASGARVGQCGDKRVQLWGRSQDSRHFAKQGSLPTRTGSTSAGRAQGHGGGDHVGHSALLQSLHGALVGRLLSPGPPPASLAHCQCW